MIIFSHRVEKIFSSRRENFLTAKRILGRTENVRRKGLNRLFIGENVSPNLTKRRAKRLFFDDLQKKSQKCLSVHEKLITFALAFQKMTLIYMHP